MNCKDIIKVLEEMSPVESAGYYDNIGLLAGRKDTEIHKILITLDVTNDVVTQAINEKVDMIISHHPIIFKEIKSVTEDTYTGNKILKLIQSDICCYALHTNFDASTMGKLAGKKLNLTETSILEPVSELLKERGGYGCVGNLSSQMKLEDFISLLKETFDLEQVLLYGYTENVKRIAILPGSGKSQIKHAIKYGAQIYITGDLDHHTALDAIEQGLVLIDAGHYGTEKMMVPYLKNFLEEKFQKEIQVITAKESSPYKII